MPQRTLAASSRADRARPTLRGCYSRTPPPSIGKWTGRISTYGCRAPTARRRPPRPESIRARRRQTLVGRGRGLALSPSSPGARGASGSRRDRAAWRPGAAGPHNSRTPERQSRTPDASRRPSARRANRSSPLCLGCALRACDQRPAPRPWARAPRACTRPRAGASGRAQPTRCDSGSWAGRRPSLADYIRGPTAPRGAPAAEGASVVYARNTQSDSHFPRRFPDPVPPNSHVTRSLKTGPRGGAAWRSDEIHLEGEASRFRWLRAPATMNDDGLADAGAALTHRRVREAGRTHGRGNTTALAIYLKLRE
jgi:hypothetical protein